MGWDQSLQERGVGSFIEWAVLNVGNSVQCCNESLPPHRYSSPPVHPSLGCPAPFGLMRLLSTDAFNLLGQEYNTLHVKSVEALLLPLVLIY